MPIYRFFILAKLFVSSTPLVEGGRNVMVSGWMDGMEPMKMQIFNLKLTVTGGDTSVQETQIQNDINQVTSKVFVFFCWLFI